MDQNIFSTDFMFQAIMTLLIGVAITGVFAMVLAAIGYILFLWNKFKHREHESLHSTLLQIALPRDNEIKIDAAEQLFASLSSIAHHSRFSFLHMQHHLSFE